MIKQLSPPIYWSFWSPDIGLAKPLSLDMEG